MILRGRQRLTSFINVKTPSPKMERGLFALLTCVCKNLRTRSQSGICAIAVMNLAKGLLLSITTLGGVLAFCTGSIRVVCGLQLQCGEGLLEKLCVGLEAELVQHFLGGESTVGDLLDTHTAQLEESIQHIGGRGLVIELVFQSIAGCCQLQFSREFGGLTKELLHGEGIAAADENPESPVIQELLRNLADRNQVQDCTFFSTHRRGGNHPEDPQCRAAVVDRLAQTRHLIVDAAGNTDGFNLLTGIGGIVRQQSADGVVAVSYAELLQCIHGISRVALQQVVEAVHADGHSSVDFDFVFHNHTPLMLYSWCRKNVLIGYLRITIVARIM